MKLNDLKIGAQLRLGLGLILALVVALGVLARVQTSRLWGQTQGLYEHPFAVREALGRLEVDVESMSRHAQSLFLAGSEQETLAALQGIELNKLDAERQLRVLYDRYLGPRDDVTALHEEFVRWNTIRDETIQRVKAGRIAETVDRIQSGGVQNIQAEKVGLRLKKIDDFAWRKAGEFYQTATDQNVAIARQLMVVVSVIFLLSLIVALVLIKRI